MKISKKWTKLDNRGVSDVEFVFVAFLIVMIFIFVIMFYYVLFSGIEVHAAESETEQSETMTEYTFYYKKAITSSDHGDGFVQATLIFSAPSHIKFFGLRDPREGYDEFFIYAIDDTRSYGVSRWVNCNYDNNKCVKTFSYDDGYVSTSEESYCTLATSSSAIYIDMFSKSTFEFGSYNFFTDLKYSLSPNIPLFDTYEAALSFVRDGDTSGQINKPEVGISVPDISTTQANQSISLLDFSADNQINVSWSGITEQKNFSDEVETTNNSFVTVDFGFADKDNPSNVILKSYDRAFKINDLGFYIPINDVLTLSEGKYLQYIKVTPYHYNLDDVTGRLYKGNASYAYYDSEQNLSWYDEVKIDIANISGAGKRRGTVYLSNFYLSGVSVSNYDLLGTRKISWTGTTKDADVILVPDDDTAVIVTYIVYNNDSDKSTTPMTYSTTTIGEGSIHVNYAKLIEESENNDFFWNGKIRLTPTYLSNGILYIGEQTVIDLSDNSITNEGTSEDGSLLQEDMSNAAYIDSNSITNYTNTFINYLKVLVSQLGQLPALYSAVFSFLPSIYIDSIGVMFLLILILRILGR